METPHVGLSARVLRFAIPSAISNHEIWNTCVDGAVRDRLFSLINRFTASSGLIAGAINY
jgi:hypothetical protein